MKLRHTIENEITWGQLKAAAAAGTAHALVKPFDEIDVTMENGEAVTVVVAAILQARVDRPAGVRFMFKDCLGAAHQMNKAWSNMGGYMISEGRRHVLEDVLPLLPADLRKVIRPRKIVEIADGKKLEYEDPLWLPSETDLFGRGKDSWQGGVADGAEDFQLPIFLTGWERRKKREDSATLYWCRSVRVGNYYSFCLVNEEGEASTDFAGYYWGVAPGFDL